MGNSGTKCVSCEDDTRLRGNTWPNLFGRQISMEEDTVSLVIDRTGSLSQEHTPRPQSKGGAGCDAKVEVGQLDDDRKCSIDRDGSWSREEEMSLEGAREGPEPEPPVDEAAGALADRLKIYEEWTSKIINQDGFFVGLQPPAQHVVGFLEGYGYSGASSASADEVRRWLCDMRTRVATDEAFDGSRILGAVLSESSLTDVVDGRFLPAYLWQVKQVVPILRIDHELSAMKKGVQLMEIPEGVDDLLDRAVNAEVFAIKTRCTIGAADKKGIRSAVRQQFEFARRAMNKGLGACLQVEVKPDATNKEACERVLAGCILEALGELQAEEKVILDLSLPEEPNLFLPLIGHPCTMRVTGLSGGSQQDEACRMLELNLGMVASFGRAFVESLQVDQKPEEFTKVLKATCDALYLASMAVPTKEVQIIKVAQGDGFFVALDQTGMGGTPILQRYGVASEELDKAELSRKLHQMRSRIFHDPKFNGSRVIGVTLSEDSMDRKISGMPSAKYLWQVKHVVPFLKVDRSHAKETNGVRLINDTSKLDEVLEKASSAGMFGTKARASIRLANAAGIKAVVDQQFEIASKVLAKGLVPILMPEVDISSPEKGACEELLLDALMAGLQKLRSDEKVIFWLTLPTKSNQYFPLIHHPNAIRLVALSGGYNRGESCQMLKQNCGMVAGFGRAFTEDLRASMTDKEFSKVLDEACEQVFRVSRRLPVKEEQAVKVGGQEGFFVALDQTGGSTKRILEAYGWDEKEQQSSVGLQAQAKLHAFRSRVFTHPRFNGSRVIGVLLSTDAMDREIARLPTAQYLWEQKKVVPFLRVDRGLQSEADGVQLMRDVPNLGALLEKAVQVGFFGTKHRNLILLPNANGIKQAVEQQFEIAKMSLQRGLVPILHLEVDINSPDKAGCERILRQSLMSGLRTLDKKDKVIFLLSIPTKTDTFRSLMGHAQVLRVMASSGGYKRDQACDKLVENQGLVASFGRAFLDGMNRRQTADEFAKAMDDSCDAIFQASRRRADAFAAAAMGRHDGVKKRDSLRRKSNQLSGTKSPRPDDGGAIAETKSMQPAAPRKQQAGQAAPARSEHGRHHSEETKGRESAREPSESSSAGSAVLVQPAAPEPSNPERRGSMTS